MIKRTNKKINQFFDSDWYTHRYKLPRKVKPWDHYREHGEKRNFYPHPYFCPLFYKRQIRHEVGNLLDHYETFGHKQGLLTHPLHKSIDVGGNFARGSCVTFKENLFSFEHGLKQYFNSEPSDQSDIFINPYFDYDFILNQYPESSNYFHPLDWYLTTGGFQGASTSPHIDFRSFLVKQHHLLFSETTPLEWIMGDAPKIYELPDGRHHATKTSSSASSR